MLVRSMVAAAAALALISPLGSASGMHVHVRTADFRATECFHVHTPIYEAAMLCLQVDDARGQSPRWALRNNTDWVLDLDSPGSWSEPIASKMYPTRADLTSYLTRLWTNDRDGAALAVQPGETVFMPADLNIDSFSYPIPDGELRFNPKATAAMVALTSAVASADKVATDRSKLYKIVKRAKACATAGANALVATDQSSDAYAAVLANLTAYSACEKYLKGVAKQAKTKLPSSWSVVALELGDNFFVQARTSVIKLFQFAR